MVQCGDADSLITGIYSNHAYLSNVARDTVGIAPGHQHFATMHLVMMKSGPLFLADTLINQNLKAETLVDIALCLLYTSHTAGAKQQDEQRLRWPSRMASLLYRIQASH